MQNPEIIFKTKVSQLKHLLNVHILEIGKSQIIKIGGIKQRVLCSINSNEFFQAGMMALGQGRAYITINNKRMKLYKIKNGDAIDVALKKDTSEFGVPMPDELKEVLLQDDDGNKRFELLAKSKQRYIINYVNTVKSPQLRIERAIKLINNLKKEIAGKENFRAIFGLDPK